MYKILEEVNLENGSKYKIKTLKGYIGHKNEELIKRVLRMAYDKVAFTYGITLKNVEWKHQKGNQSLEWALDILETRLATREVTGNDAIDLLTLTLEELNKEDAHVVKGILDRDLRINMGRSNINKVFKSLIKKPVYQRCGVFNFDSQKDGKLVKGTYRKINYPAILNLKADGTYRETYIPQEGKIEFQSRSGEVYEYPILEKQFKNFQKQASGYCFGELTVILDQKLLDEIIPAIKEEDPEMAAKIIKDFKAGDKILPRSLGNGLINSDRCPHNNLAYDVWEYVTEKEYQNAADKVKNTTPYVFNFLKLAALVKDLDGVNIIEHVIVNNYAEAIAQVSKWMRAGLEGGVLKNLEMFFKDGTNQEQLKMKLEIDAEVRCTGFYEGTGRRLKTFGGMTFKNDEGTLVGRTSGFTDAMLEDFNKRRSELIGKVFTIRFNDITKARGADTWALSHPRFIEFRDDKDETDTLVRLEELKKMATIFVSRGSQITMAKATSKELKDRLNKLANDVKRINAESEISYADL